MRQRNIKGYRIANVRKMLDSLEALGEKATDAELLADYDRRGGLLFKMVSGEAVRLDTGHFYDFEKGAPKKVSVAKKEEKKATKEAKKSKKKK